MSESKEKNTTAAGAIGRAFLIGAIFDGAILYAILKDRGGAADPIRCAIYGAILGASGALHGLGPIGVLVATVIGGAILGDIIGDGRGAIIGAISGAVVQRIKASNRT